MIVFNTQNEKKQLKKKENKIIKKYNENNNLFFFHHKLVYETVRVDFVMKAIFFKIWVIFITRHVTLGASEKFSRILNEDR